MSLYNAKFNKHKTLIGGINISTGAPILNRDWVGTTVTIDVTGYQKARVKITNNGGSWNLIPGQHITATLLCDITAESPRQLMIIGGLGNNGRILASVHTYYSDNEVQIQLTNIWSSSYIADVIEFQFVLI